MEINNLIGETNEYEKKVAVETRKPKSWCKSVSAFANGAGGYLIFGAADDGTYPGLKDPEKDAEIISEIIKTHLNPIPDFSIYFQTLQNLSNHPVLVILEVKPGTQTPYYYSGDKQLIAFIRIGNESITANPLQLRELILKSNGSSYDSLRSIYHFESMSFTKLKSVYWQRTGNPFEDTDFESFGIVDKDGFLTNAGALLADESPLRHSRLFCTRWNGTDKASGIDDALDDREYSGSLITLLQSGIEFVTGNSKKRFRKFSDRRVEMPEYPERAVTEGLVNALIHRSYTEIGSEVHIDHPAAQTRDFSRE